MDGTAYRGPAQHELEALVPVSQQENLQMRKGEENTWKQRKKKGVFREPLLFSVILFNLFLLPLRLNNEKEAKLIQITIYHVLT